MIRTSLLAALLWLFGCSLGGLIVALATVRHGSIMYFVFGVALGVGGGFASALLYASQRFCALRARWRRGAVFTGAMLFALFVGGYTLGWETAAMPFLAFSLAPATLLAAVSIDHVVLRRRPLTSIEQLALRLDPRERALVRAVTLAGTPASPPSIPPASPRE